MSPGPDGCATDGGCTDQGVAFLCKIKAPCARSIWACTTSRPEMKRRRPHGPDLRLGGHRNKTLSEIACRRRARAPPLAEATSRAVSYVARPRSSLTPTARLKL